MYLGQFKNDLSRAVRENHGKNLLICVLALCNLGAIGGWLFTKKSVVLVPPMHDERLEVSYKQASVGYKKAWALTVSELAGNVTPGNADMVLKSLGELLSPAAYRGISEELAKQVGEIKRDSLTVSFEPRQVLYEPVTQKVFITGQFASKGVSGSPIETTRTYETTVEIRFGRPWITSFKPYSGMPMTVDSAKQRVARVDD